VASRTRQKEEARARRLAEEEAHAKATQRNRQLRMLGGIVLAAIAVVAVFIAVSSGGKSGGSGIQTGTAASKTATEVEQMFAGIPQSGATLGSPSAPVTMTYYGDLQCPVCADFSISGGFPQLVANEVRQGKVKVVYKAFQTATHDPQVFQDQHVAALAAGKQQRLWNYVDLFYRQQGAEGSGYVTENFLTTIANQIPGLNISKWQTDRKDPALTAQVQADQAAGAAANIQGTPTVIFDGPKGKASPSSGVPTYSDLQNAIKQVS
jgi:protein-disulfide isomerase